MTYINTHSIKGRWGRRTRKDSKTWKLARAVKQSSAFWRKQTMALMNSQELLPDKIHMRSSQSTFHHGKGRDSVAQTSSWGARQRAAKGKRLSFPKGSSLIGGPCNSGWLLTYACVGNTNWIQWVMKKRDLKLGEKLLVGLGGVGKNKEEIIKLHYVHT